MNVPVKIIQKPVKRRQQARLTSFLLIYVILDGPFLRSLICVIDGINKRRQDTIKLIRNAQKAHNTKLLQQYYSNKGNQFKNNLHSINQTIATTTTTTTTT